MLNFAGVVDILDEAVGGADKPVGGRHRAFWRNISRDEFIQKKVLGDVKLIKQDDGRYDGPNSNLVLALKGWAPFGKDLGVQGAQYPRMPKGLPGVPAESILQIQQWITAGCPDGPAAAEATGRATDT